MRYARVIASQSCYGDLDSSVVIRSATPARNAAYEIRRRWIERRYSNLEYFKEAAQVATSPHLKGLRSLRKWPEDVSKWLFRLGFVPGTSENLSIRVGFNCILSTPTGCSKYAPIVADSGSIEIVIVDRQSLRPDSIKKQ